MFSFLSDSTTLTIPKSELGYHTNNKYPSFPPIMSDGRSLISSWQNETQFNHKIIVDNNIKTNWEYRQYLAKNAKAVMEYNFRECANDTGYVIPKKEDNNNNNTKIMTPYLFNSLNDRSNPFQRSDLKEIYLTREQLNAKKVSPYVNVNK